jgi:hypothetical protein
MSRLAESIGRGQGSSIIQVRKVDSTPDLPVEVKFALDDDAEHAAVLFGQISQMKSQVKQAYVTKEVNARAGNQQIVDQANAAIRQINATIEAAYKELNDLFEYDTDVTPDAEPADGDPQ